jgi:hypothetical protein
MTDHHSGVPQLLHPIPYHMLRSHHATPPAGACCSFQVLFVMSFLGRFLFQLLACCVLYLAAVRLIDPYGTYGTHIFPVVLVQDRTEKKRLFEKYARDRPVTGVVLGSSRSMMLSPKLLENLTHQRYFNFAVSGASIHDLAEIYDWLRGEGVHLEHIIVGLDTDGLMVSSRVDSGQPVSALGRLVQKAKGVKAMFTIPVAEDTWRALAISVDLIHPDRRITFEPDGHEKINEDLAGREVYTASCVVAWRRKFQGLNRVSNRYFEQLESIFRQARADGAAVTVFITPINPATERRMEFGTPYFDHKREVSMRAKALAEKWQVAFADFGDANTFGAEPEGWSDCVHYDSENGNRLARRLLQGGGP